MTVILLAISFAQPAEGIEIPLNELTGVYEMQPDVPPDFGAPAVRTADFVVPDGFGASAEAYLVISGEWHAGEMTCNVGGGIYHVYPYFPELFLEMSSDAFPDDFFIASLLMEMEGTFNDVAIPITSCCPYGVIGVDRLLGAEVHANLIMDIGLVGGCWVSLDSYGTLSDARIEINEAVPVESMTWSALKRRYE